MAGGFDASGSPYFDYGAGSPWSPAIDPLPGSDGSDVSAGSPAGPDFFSADEIAALNNDPGGPDASGLVDPGSGTSLGPAPIDSNGDPINPLTDANDGSGGGGGKGSASSASSGGGVSGGSSGGGGGKSGGSSGGSSSQAQSFSLCKLLPWLPFCSTAPTPAKAAAAKSAGTPAGQKLTSSALGAFPVTNVLLIGAALLLLRKGGK